MTRDIPSGLEESARSAIREGSQGLLAMFDRLEDQHPGTGWLALWKIANVDPAPEFARTLSYILAKSGAPIDLAEAIRIWFLNDWTGSDLSTAVNLLTGVEAAIDSDNGLPRALRSSVLPFLSACLEHEQPVVQHSVLDLLTTSVE